MPLKLTVEILHVHKVSEFYDQQTNSDWFEGKPHALGQTCGTDNLIGQLQSRARVVSPGN
jgi:hypothetical protein